MMQVTRAAFPVLVNLNKQATDPKSHTPVSTFYTRISPVPLPAIPMVDPPIETFGGDEPKEL
jgi:hypothetical protein